METTGSVGKMSGGCRCCRYKHGKEVTEEQHSTKRRHVHNHHEVNSVAFKMRWNKKLGILEKSRKNSNIQRWLY